MLMCWLRNIIIFVVTNSVIKNEISCENLDFPSSKSLIDIKGNQENAAGLHSNVVDIHVAMQSDNNPQNLREIIRDEIKSLVNADCNTSTLVDIDVRGPVAVRSIKDNLEKSDLHKKLDYLVNEIRSVKDELEAKKSISSFVIGENIDLEAKCLEEEHSLGVRYTYCKQILKKEKNYPKNCKEVQENGNNTSGIYKILPKYAKAPFPVLCDMETRSGGWTHIQKRFDGSQDFFLEWKDYKFGFGNLEGEFWLGLENIHLLTDFENTELLIEIVDRDNVTAYAFYKTFSIGPEAQGYKMERLTGFSGDAGDSLTPHSGQKFSTKDLDFTKENCATLYKAGWWYKACHVSNLNGKYINVELPEKYKFQGMHWLAYRGHEYCHSKSRMLIRPSS